MRRVIFLVVALLLMSFPVFAGTSDTVFEQTMTLTNTGATVAYTVVNSTNYTSGIVPGYHAITGFTALPLTKAATNFYEAALYDAASNTSLSATRLMGESLGVVNTTSGSFFAFPRSINYGLIVGLAPNTTAIIEYTH